MGAAVNAKIYEFSVKKINGEPITFKAYQGQVLLVVNVASECGLTPQYEALEKLYQKYQAQGFSVLAFPANEFGAQEPGSNSEIQEFCTTKFGVRFPMFEKVIVKGEGQHPLFHHLIQSQPEAQMIPGQNFEEKLKTYGIFREKKIDILWNFEKFLIGKDGSVVARFSPDIEPDNQLISKAIESELAR